MDVRPKYPRILRIPHPSGFRAESKRYLGLEDLRCLFDGQVFVEEKLDGSQFSIQVYEGELLVWSRGRLIVEGFEPLAYRGIWRWIYAHFHDLMGLGENLVLYGEWLKVLHTVPYDALPDWAVIFDVYDLERGQFLRYDEKVEVVNSLGLVPPPLLYRGIIHLTSKREVERFISHLVSIAERKSFFSTVARSMEGVVVKNYEKQFFAKLINPWFDREISEHELFEKGIKYNKLLYSF